MSVSEEDIELHSALPKNSKKKPPTSPSEEILNKNKESRKVSTKIMINQALSDLKKRKGVSLYAIKKYIEEKYEVDVKKINYHIKNQIKTGLEAGSILQTKGTGVSGSFKLAAAKPEKREKKTKNPSEEPKKALEKETIAKKQTSKEPIKKSASKEKDKPKKVSDKKEATKRTKTEKSKMEMEKKDDENSPKKQKKPKVKVKEFQTPAKKRAAMMKRKSIGSIIKAPKMKPKNK